MISQRDNKTLIFHVHTNNKHHWLKMKSWNKQHTTELTFHPILMHIVQKLWRLKKKKKKKVTYFNTAAFYLRDEVHEAGQRLIRLVPHVAELHHHLLLQLVIDDGHGEWRRLVRQETTIVCALQVQLQICRGGILTESTADKKALF